MRKRIKAITKRRKKKKKKPVFKINRKKISNLRLDDFTRSIITSNFSVVNVTVVYFLRVSKHTHSKWGRRRENNAFTPVVFRK